MGPARIYPWRKMHRSRARSIAPGTFFVAQSWADCVTNMPGFNLRQAQRLIFLESVAVAIIVFIDPDQARFGIRQMPLNQCLITSCLPRRMQRDLLSMPPALTKITSGAASGSVV